MQLTSSMQRSTGSPNSSSRAGRSMLQPRPNGNTVRHYLAARVSCSAATVLRDPPGMVIDQKDDSPTSSTGTADSCSKDLQQPQDLSSPRQSVTSPQSPPDDERLLTLQLLNNHTQSIAAQGYTVHAAAVAPAEVNAQLWTQRIVELYAKCKQLSFAEAQRQVNIILGNPQETPCFVAFGPCHTADASGDKTVVAMVVGSITKDQMTNHAKKASSSKHGIKDGSSFASVQQKHLQIDTLCIECLAGRPCVTAMQDPYSDALKGGCSNLDCCSCRSQNMCSTLLLWLMGEAGCFDHTDARVSLSAPNCNSSVLCLFSQLGFEPWHEPRGPPASAYWGSLGPSSGSSSSSGSSGRSSSVAMDCSSSNGNRLQRPAAIRGMDSPHQGSVTEDHQQHKSSAARCLGQSFLTGTESSVVSKQRPVSAELQRTMHQNQTKMGDAGVHSHAVVSLCRPAGLLTELQQPCAVEQLIVHDGHVHDGVNMGVAVEKSHARSNVLPFNRRSNQ